jgi:hemerythrin-like domain-containing protein
MQDGVRRGVVSGLLAGAGCLALAACKGSSPPPADPSARAKAQSGPGCEQENEILPVEDLMREHGVLRRILLVYGECIRRIESQPPQEFPPEALSRSAGVVRRFVEDYHERLEEDFLFPRFEKAGTLVSLVQVLKGQHQAGRRITQQIARAAQVAPQEGRARRALVDPLRDFVRMYEPHAAREDTVLFPALHGIVSAHEYDVLGEEFESQETKLFGKDGFERVVAEVAEIEKSLGLDDLARFTPR